MPGDLGALPRAKMSIKLATKFENFLFEALKFGVVAVRAYRGEAAQFLDIFFETLDFFLALEVGRPFLSFFAAHITKSFGYPRRHRYGRGQR